MKAPRIAAALFAALTMLATAALPAHANGAPTTAQSTLVSANPWDYTPFVRNGKVLAVAQVGNRIIVGGNFSDIKNWQGGAPVYNPTNIFAFNATTGAIDTAFLPSFNGEVRALVPAADGLSVYVGGTFTQVNGAPAANLVKLSVANGQAVTAFAPGLNGWVNDMSLSGNTLYIGGHFDKVRNLIRPRLAAIDATTGRARSDFTVAVTTAIRTSPWVSKLDVSADGSKLVIIGNFLNVDGQARSQLAVINLTTSPASVSPWDTARYPSTVCSASFESYLRDVDIAPDGSYFVVVSTGAWKGTNTLCDAAARWDFGSMGAGQQPNWADYTGGDTLYSVATTGSAVYVGGHQRWHNNSNTPGGDRAGVGSVVRNGIAALDPVNGLPFSWNPGRDRGVGAFAILPTADGIYVGHDTNAIGGEWHPRITKFPTAGGATPPRYTPTSLPTTLYTAGADDTLSSRSYDATTVGSPTLNNTSAWSHMRGSFMAAGSLYTGWDDGRLSKRTFDGTTFGAPVDLASWTSFASVRAMAYDNGRIYYTNAGDSNLSMRSFELENGLVGSQQFTVSGPGIDGLNWSTATGLTAAGGQLLAARDGGTLDRTTLKLNGVIAGTQATVSGPAIDGQNWTSVGLFAFNG